ncbi:LysR family transcriptional regulator [Citrobacter sp. JGM124]|uniref:LysR family transcriptional regulator n=1 Tax=Citrobacter sp. JGM124 TaxID=2799789 RepID=UPI001BAA641C|nr:LysR family transcriptional regulator [Citrobacter sp. JGM124]MBS0847057.1 LysR family transcriptional regulator [Citrobacter sp. JGM124]
MLRFEDLTLFVRAALLGNFSAVAREVGIQPSQVSTAIKRLEDNLNTRLFVRSTRHLRLTPEGETWLPYAVSVLQTLETGYQQLKPSGGEIRGSLQIAVPSDLGRHLLLDVFQSFRQSHPALQLKLQFSDQVSDIFKDPVDIAFRYGNPEDASYVALPVAAENRRVLVASARYLSRFGTPMSLDDLTQHAVLIYALHGRAYDRWTFQRRGQQHHVTVQGSLISNDAEVVRRLAIRGEGIAYKSWIDVSDNVKAGDLQVLLPQYEGDSLPLNLICPHRQQLSTAVRLLYEKVKNRCEQALVTLPVIE